MKTQLISICRSVRGDGSFYFLLSFYLFDWGGGGGSSYVFGEVGCIFISFSFVY